MKIGKNIILLIITIIQFIVIATPFVLFWKIGHLGIAIIWIILSCLLIVLIDNK